MKIPRFWVRAQSTGRDRNRRRITIEACGWSDISLEDARRRAEERALRAIERFQSPRPIVRDQAALREYGYGDVPPREEVVERIEVAGREVAVVTRNAYGALVLNTDCVLFVDVDEPNPRGASVLSTDVRSLAQRVFKLFGRSEPTAQRGGATVETPEARLRAWIQGHSEAGLNLYRTAGGWRLAVIDRVYEPSSERVRTIFQEVGADPLYVRLTQRQQCFRARLTPKPWRCGCPRPPARFPWADARAEEAFRRWEAKYREKCSVFTACLPPERFGRAADDPAIRAVLALHDRLACTSAGRLA